jgi:NADH:ubiquinone oxidoreductase subunit F (NADH-binding)/(2Fe-2S) ferredoxin
MNKKNDLYILQEQASNKINIEDGYRVLVGMGTCGISSGAKAVLDAINKQVADKGLTNVKVLPTGCIGMCVYEPIVEIFAPGKEKISYTHVDPEKAVEIVENHLIKGEPLGKYTVEYDGNGQIKNLNDIQFYQKQKRVVLKNCGSINPEDIDEYIAQDGYKAVHKALTEMTPQEVIDTITASGLRGRGGAGFPTGKKWGFAAANKADQKYIVCNADEGDPGAFMDRSILEGDPHSILEAMIIGGYSFGATKGFIYVRAEYPVAVKRLQIAIDQAKALGFLGKDIFGSGFDFDIEIRLGAGAFVCGEETALIASIEGKRGMSRNKPPFPAVKGLWGKPTCINNVETLGNIPQIILKGPDWFKSFGTERSSGTKVFALGGNINNTGLVEVPMGITLREIIYDIGGGCPGDRAFKAVQTGGPSGGCLTNESLDTPIDFDNLVAVGSMMGSGGMIAIDEDNCMVDIARFFLDFTVDESCGKCTPCREGTKRMHEILNKMTRGTATVDDLNTLEELAENIQLTSLCALGQTAPNPVLSTIKHFRDEYEAHVIDKTCPAGVCSALLSYVITDNCNGCTRCARQCPEGAIIGKVKEKHIINQQKCIKCGICMDVCTFNAVIRE